MLPDRVSNPGPLTFESGALPIALRGPAGALVHFQGKQPFRFYFCLSPQWQSILTGKNLLLGEQILPIKWEVFRSVSRSPSTLVG